MSEADFRRQAQHYDGIRCDFYPPRSRQQKPILKTLQAVTVGPFRVESERWTDGGSVPRIAHSVAHPLGYLFPAFLVHDVSLFDGLGWGQSNARFDRAMKALGAPHWQRVAVLSAVKLNGKWQNIRASLGWEAKHVRNK